MRLKRYIFLSLLLMLAVGGLIYLKTDATYTIEILGIPVTLPIAVWMILPMFLMFVASFFHMAYYSFINYMKLKRYKKDYDTLVKSFAQALLREPKAQQYKTREAKNLGHITDKSHLIPQDFRIDTKDERLKKPLEYVKDIQNGIYVEIEGFELSPKNPLLVQNLQNRLKKEPTFSGVILKKCQDYPKDLCQKALEIYMDFSDISKIKEYASVFTFETLLKLIDKAAQKREHVHYQDLLYIVQEAKMELGQKEYIELAKKIKNIMAPDDRLRFFELLKEKDERSEAGYVYTLLDLEMVDKARDFLETTNEEELQNFKAYLELKDCGKNYPLDLFA